jgi:hypothetical protein
LYASVIHRFHIRGVFDAGGGIGYVAYADEDVHLFNDLKIQRFEDLKM